MSAKKTIKKDKKEKSIKQIMKDGQTKNQIKQAPIIVSPSSTSKAENNS